MSDGPENQARGSSNETIGTIPDTDSCGLLFAFPPGRRDENEPGVETRFENPKKKSGSGKSAKGRGGAGGSEDNT